MEEKRLISSSWTAAELAGPLEQLPPVDFCCAYGSALLPNNNSSSSSSSSSSSDDKASMVDYILGVSDPLHWHSENLERNRGHYSSWMARLGPRAITRVADQIGVGVHFNPFVEWRDKMIKYGVVGMHDLARDVLTWDKFYLSGRLQKPVHVLIDYWDIRKVNLVNLKAAVSVALLLLPSKFTEEDLYAKICSLSYMGDLRMLFAEDKNKVRKIVQGTFHSFRAMYRPFVEEYIAEGLLKKSSCSDQCAFKQDCDLSATRSVFSSLPLSIQNQMGAKQGLRVNEADELASHLVISSREEVANCARKALRRVVMVSSAKQAVSGVLAAGGIKAACYLARKMSKAWRSRTS